MVKLAFIFPGQGSQGVGMGLDLYKNFSSAKKVYDKANDVLNKDIKKMCFEGPEETLKQTVNTQPCIVTTSIAALEALKSQLDIKPCYVAGHSLGEYCAMYSAGVMTLEQTFSAIQKRAELMSNVQTGSMVAVLKANNEQLKEALDEGAKAGYIDVANYNSSQQVVLTGDKEALERATEKLLSYIGVRCIPLAISGAFHSKYMKPVSKEFEEYVSELDLKDAMVPVVTNVDAKPTLAAEELKKKMSEQLYSSVQWQKTIEKMSADGVDTFVEIGNGRVLSGLCKRIVANAKVYNVYDKETLQDTVNELKNN